MQAAAERARDLLPDTVEGFDAAIVSLDVETGAIRVMVGGRGFKPDERELNMALSPAPDRIEHQVLHPRRRDPGRCAGGRPDRRSSRLRAAESGDPSEPIFQITGGASGFVGNLARHHRPLDQLRLRPAVADRRTQPGGRHDLPDGRVAVPVPRPARDRSRADPAVRQLRDRRQRDDAARHGVGHPDARQRGCAQGAVLRRVHRRRRRQPHAHPLRPGHPGARS